MAIEMTLNQGRLVQSLNTSPRISCFFVPTGCEYINRDIYGYAIQSRLSLNICDGSGDTSSLHFVMQLCKQGMQAQG